MSFVVVESGSTKADWAFVNNAEVKLFTSVGINPSTNPQMELVLSETIKLELTKIQTVFFYGAGVLKGINEHKIEQFLCSFNPALKVVVDTDLIAAIKSTANDKPGIICILGTGSHSCLYNGEAIVDSIPSLGYVLSDEGSGNHIGKEIIKSYFYRSMVDEDMVLFEKTFKISRDELIKIIYSQSGVSAYLASYVKFLNQSSNLLRTKILTTCFEEFVNIRIKKYNDYYNFDIHFVGSIASVFREELQKVLSTHQLKIKTIVDRPLTKLIDYHKLKK